MSLNMIRFGFSNYLLIMDLEQKKTDVLGVFS
jgi:hypothetical protein